MQDFDGDGIADYIFGGAVYWGGVGFAGSGPEHRLVGVKYLGAGPPQRWPAPVKCLRDSGTQVVGVVLENTFGYDGLDWLVEATTTGTPASRR